MQFLKELCLLLAITYFLAIQAESKYSLIYEIAIKLEALPNNDLELTNEEVKAAVNESLQWIPEEVYVSSELKSYCVAQFLITLKNLNEYANLDENDYLKTLISLYTDSKSKCTFEDFGLVMVKYPAGWLLTELFRERDSPKSDKETLLAIAAAQSELSKHAKDFRELLTKTDRKAETIPNYIKYVNYFAYWPIRSLNEAVFIPLKQGEGLSRVREAFIARMKLTNPNW